MSPLLAAGDEVLVDPLAYRQKQPVLDDIVIAEHPRCPGFFVIKRVTGCLEGDRYFLSGDNLTESSDSRDFGSIALQQIVGHVVCRFP
jgi:nickel-type superoxide dismutase maturation protease